MPCDLVQDLGCRQAVFGQNLTFKVLMWTCKWGQGHQHNITSNPVPIMYLCRFGQNPLIGSEDIVQTRSYAAADTDADVDADRIRTKSNMPPPPLRLGDIMKAFKTMAKHYNSNKITNTLSMRNYPTHLQICVHWTTKYETRLNLCVVISCPIKDVIVF